MPAARLAAPMAASSESARSRCLLLQLGHRSADACIGPCRARLADPALVAEDRSAGGVRDRTGPEPAGKGLQRARAVTTEAKEPQVSQPAQPRSGNASRGGPEFESPHLPDTAQRWAPPWHRCVVPWLAPTIVGFGGAARHRRPASPTECAAIRLAGYATTSEAARSSASRLALAARVARTTPLSRGGRPR